MPYADQRKKREAHRKWARRNREKMRQYRAKHRIKRREWNAAWRKANPDKMRAYRLAYKLKHPRTDNERSLVQQAIEADRRKRHRERTRKWKKANPERVREYRLAERAKYGEIMNARAREHRRSVKLAKIMTSAIVIHSVASAEHMQQGGIQRET